MKGQVDILVSTQYHNGNFVQIFRSLYYEYNPGDLSKRTEESKMYWLLKDNVDKINVTIETDDVEGILRNIHHMNIIYTNLPLNLAIVHGRMPRLLITFYEKIESLTFNIDKLLIAHSETELSCKLTETKQILSYAKRDIMAFWKTPERFFRLPLRIVKDDSTVELFGSELFLPYILSHELLPTWTDPVIVSVINESRKRIQTREKSEDYFLALRRINPAFDCWTIKYIIKYIPISFDLMISQTPWEFSQGKSGMKNDISVFVS